MTTTEPKAPPEAPGGLPLLGHALAMKRRAGDFLLGLQDGSPVTRIRLGPKPAYVVNDPSLMREVQRDSDVFGRGGPITERFRQLFGNGLGISDGELHSRQRALIQPAFHHGKIVGYAELMSRNAARLSESWRDGQRVAVDEAMDALALENVTQVIFSLDTEMDRNHFMSATTVVLGGLFRKIGDTTGLLTRLPTPRNREYEREAAYLRRSIREVIADYRSTGTDRGDLLSMLLLARDEDGRPAMTEQQVHDEVMTFFIAGSNTISNTLSWTFHELASNPAAERRLHAELDAVLAGRPAGYADLPQLDYTRRVVTETLRTRTQGVFLAKVTTREAVLGGYRIPAGATVFYSFHALNHSPAIHPDPERYDPDRWLPERAKVIPRGAFMPFSAGVHGCIGDQFAWAEMIIVLATLAGRWRLLPVPGHQPKPKPAITMPVDSLPMTVQRRV